MSIDNQKSQRMKKMFNILTLTLLTVNINAQNLVNNYSFEINTSCPFTSGGISLANDWQASLGSPDYYHVCASNPPYGVPENISGYQYPASGEGYIGLLGYGSFLLTLNPDTREHATGTLNQSLIPGTKYYVSFKAVLRNRSSHAMNNIGAKFILSSTLANLPITNNAQVFYTDVISDTLNWQIITGSFIADSSYTHISIGNHFDDNSTIVEDFQPMIHGFNAYYLIDDVCVSVDSVTCNSLAVGMYKPLNSALTLFPNPFTDNLIVVNSGNEICYIRIYDIASRQLVFRDFSNHVSLNTQFLSKGIYLYEITTEDGIIKKGALLKE
jgi:hypothetical protein